LGSSRGGVFVTRFVAGDRAKVIAAGDDHFGKIGIVDPAFEEDAEHVFLKFKDEPNILAFRRDEVMPVAV
jgi:hypothetical protein